MLGLWSKIDILEATNVAVTLCRLQQEKLDLALLDNDMGDGATLEAIPKLMGQLGSGLPPLIMTSGNSDARLPEKALQAGFSGFIAKDELTEVTLREIAGTLPLRPW